MYSMSHCYLTVNLNYFAEECQALQAPASGYLSLLSNGTVTRAEVSCLNGYHVRGNSTLTCDSKGVWDMETPTCGNMFIEEAIVRVSTRVNLFSRGLRITNWQTSLHICAVYSAPLLFAYWKVAYLNLLQAIFQFSS